MELSLNFLHLVQRSVLSPDLMSALALLISSLINEIIAIFPYSVVLSGQLIFMKDPISTSLLIKLFTLVAIPVGLGSALGALPVYVAGYFGGKPAIEKFSKYLRFSWDDVEKINSHFQGKWYDELAFLLLRFIPVMPALPVNIAAGILRMPFWQYFLLSFIGFTIRMALTIGIIGIGLGALSRFLIS